MSITEPVPAPHHQFRPGPDQPNGASDPPWRRPHGPSGPEPDSTPRRPWGVLALALAAQVLVVLDISVVNTALPSIGRSLHL